MIRTGVKPRYRNIASSHSSRAIRRTWVVSGVILYRSSIRCPTSQTICPWDTITDCRSLSGSGTFSSIRKSLTFFCPDLSEEAIQDYVRRGTCYGGFADGVLIGQYVLLPTRPFTVELVNIAVKEPWQNQGIGKKNGRPCHRNGPQKGV